MFVTILIAVSTTYILWLLTRRCSKADEPPMVAHWLPWIGSGLQFQKNPTKFLRACERKHGPMFTVFMGGKYFHFVMDPLTHPAIARESQKLSFRIHTTPMIKKIFDFYRRKSNEKTNDGHLVSYFQGKGLDYLIKEMGSNLEEALRDERYFVKDWENFSLLEFCHSVMFTSSFHTLFGKKEKTDGFHNIQLLIKNFKKFDEAFPLLAKGYPISFLKGVQEARESFWKLFSYKSLQKRQGVLKMFHEMYEKCENTNDQERISKETLSILWAAGANTIMSSFWVLYFILKNPDALKSAKNEVNEMIKSKILESEDEALNFDREDLSKMMVLDSIINESLRMSVSSANLRQAVEDLDIDVVATDRKYRVRQGDSVFVLFQFTHMDPAIYDEPEVFKYDRFLAKDKTTKLKFYKNGNHIRYNFQPFGSGLSICPGRYWAMAEIKQFLILILHRFDIELERPSANIEFLQNRVAMGALFPSVDPVIRIKRKIAE